MQKPNILFVMADQMSAKALALYGTGQAKTPALAQLAARGTLFENAYCNAPLCGPSRQSMMSGALPCSIGGYDNATALAYDIPTYAHYLAQAGYRTCLSGKMHFVGADQLHGFQERLTTDIYPADFCWTPDWEDTSGTVRFQDMQNIFTAGPCARSMQIDYDEDVAFQAERWLYDRARDGENAAPWALTVSFTSPHDPYTALPQFWDLYQESEIELPRVTADDCVPDAHTLRLRAHYSIDETPVDDAALRRARHGYYAAISYVDAKLARLMQVLKQSGQSENTIVVFTSDHGDMMGERGLYFKKCFFEWAMRVPLVMAGPNIAQGHQTQRPVSLVDILPTFCDIAGVSPLHSDGVSLQTDSSCPVYGEYTAEGVQEPLFMIRKGAYKLHWSASDPPILYDLEHDPDERCNLAYDPAYGATLARLVALAEQKWKPKQLRKQIIDSQKRRRILQYAGAPAWDYAPDLSQKDRYVRAGRWTVEVEAEGHLNLPASGADPTA